MYYGLDLARSGARPARTAVNIGDLVVFRTTRQRLH